MIGLLIRPGNSKGPRRAHDSATKITVDCSFFPGLEYVIQLHGLRAEAERRVRELPADYRAAFLAGDLQDEATFQRVRDEWAEQSGATPETQTRKTNGERQ